MFLRGVAQLGLERLIWDQEAAGSNPVTPILKRRHLFMCRRFFVTLKSEIKIAIACV